MTTGLKTYKVTFISKSNNTYTMTLQNKNLETLAKSIGAEIAEGNPAYSKVDAGRQDIAVLMTSEIESFFITKVTGNG